MEYKKEERKKIKENKEKLQQVVHSSTTTERQKKWKENLSEEQIKLLRAQNLEYKKKQVKKLRNRKTQYVLKKLNIGKNYINMVNYLNTKSVK